MKKIIRFSHDLLLKRLYIYITIKNAELFTKSKKK